jgi:hypothetical protein
MRGKIQGQYISESEAKINVKEKESRSGQLGFALQSEILRDPVGPVLWVMRGIHNGFRRGAASKVLNHLFAESPNGLKLHFFQNSEEEKAFRIRCPVISDMLATFGRHLEDNLWKIEARKRGGSSVLAG